MRLCQLFCIDQFLHKQRLRGTHSEELSNERYDCQRAWLCGLHGEAKSAMRSWLGFGCRSVVINPVYILQDIHVVCTSIYRSLVYVRTKMQQRENLERALQREVARITHQFPPNKTITVEVVQLPAAANTSGRAILGDTHGGGALLYILVFLFVYGVVAAFLVVFNVAKSRRKLMQDQQINEYLKVMRVVQRTSSRSHRRHRKMAIVAKLNASPHLQQSAAMPRPMSSSRGQWTERPAPDRGDAEERRLLSMERKTDDIQLETIPSSTCVSGLEETSTDIEEHGNECDDSYDFDFTLLQTSALRTSNV